MAHLKILGIKFITITFTLFAFFGVFAHVTWGRIFLIGALTTIISYLIGDRLVLPRFGNLTASIADFGMYFVTIWLFGAFIIGWNVPIVTISLLAAFFIACVEPFIHRYIVKRLDFEKHDRDISVLRNDYATEFAQEMDGHDHHDFYYHQRHSAPDAPNAPEHEK